MFSEITTLPFMPTTTVRPASYATSSAPTLFMVVNLGHSAYTRALPDDTQPSLRLSPRTSARRAHLGTTEHLGTSFKVVAKKQSLRKCKIGT